MTEWIDEANKRKGSHKFGRKREGQLAVSSLHSLRSNWFLGPKKEVSKGWFSQRERQLLKETEHKGRLDYVLGTLDRGWAHSHGQGPCYHRMEGTSQGE